MIKPILKYPGAKWRLAPWIVQYLPRMPHYIEPYCGSASVFFALPWRPKHAVLNDLSGDIVNLFRVIRERGNELAALIEMTPWSYQEYQESFDRQACDLENARRFLVNTWQMHGTRTNSANRGQGWRNVGFKGDAVTTSTWNRLPRVITESIAFLKDAEIDHAPAVDLIHRYAGDNVLIYADPPYPLSTRSHVLYEHEMTDADHVTLLDALDAHPGPAVLSGYACALYDDRLPHWHRITMPTQAEKGKARTEVLWLNDKAANSRQHMMELAV